MNKTLQHYARLREQLSVKTYGKTEYLLSGLESANLVEPEHITCDHAGVWEKLESFQPVEGWLCFQSAVKPFSDGELPKADEESGWVLAGEMVNSHKESLHIRQHPYDGWVVTTFKEQPGGDYLVQSFVFLSTDEKNLGKLKYRVFWEYHPEYGYQRRFSRFTGFVQKGKAL